MAADHWNIPHKDSGLNRLVAMESVSHASKFLELAIFKLLTEINPICTFLKGVHPLVLNNAT